MKKNLTEIALILDMSGSMGNLVEDTIGGYNSLIEKQKQEEGEAYITTVLFDDRYILLHDHENIKDIKPLTTNEYRPMGMTALLDAIGKTVNSIGIRLSNTPEEERPEKVVIAITTDGLENSSKEFTKTKIKEMIEHQQSKYSWIFMFLGANVDAFAEAGSLGIKSDYVQTFSANSAGTNSVYSTFCGTLSAIRSSDYSNDVNNEVYQKSVTNFKNGVK